MTGVPARRAESCSQVDEDVAGNLFLAEGLRLRQYFLTIRQSAVGLLVDQRPKRWNVWVSGGVRIPSHDLDRITTHNDEDIEGQRHLWISRFEAPAFAAKIKTSKRQVEEHSPA